MSQPSPAADETSQSASATVHRLLDMVVEEVSLVDHAANQHRFLIVKRRQPMDQQQTTGVADETASRTTDAAPENDEVIDLNEVPEEPDTEGATNGPVLAIATQALERLTDTVEALGQLPADVATPKVRELAAELRSVAGRLTRSLGEDPPTGSARGNSAEPTLAGVSELISAARLELNRLKELVATPGAGAQPQAGSEGVSADGTDDIAARLDTLVTELQAMGATVKEQQQRLSRMEKSIGMPNSTPVGEQTSQAGADDEVGWPLDLNRTLDRDSVDKTVSFHEV